jgi:ABC-type amino acid transport substrate-binding protein
MTSTRWLRGWVLGWLVLGFMILMGWSSAYAQVPAEYRDSPTIQEILKRGALQTGTSLAAPSAFKDPKTGEITGAVIEIGREVANRMGVKLQVEVTGWDTIIAGLQAKRYDIACAGLFETPARKQVVDFVTWDNEGIAFLVKKDNDKIKTVADLDKPEVTIATVTGSGSEQMVKKEIPKATIRSVISPSGGSGAPPEEVISGRVGAAQFDAILTIAYLQRFPSLKVVPADAFENPLYPTPVGIAIRKGDEKFRAFLASVVDDMTKRRVIQDAKQRWSQPELLLEGQ